MQPDKTISIIVAYTQNRIIGVHNTLPWGKLRNDMSRFAHFTAGRDVVMGRKTFESIGRPLVGRYNIIVSTTMSATPGPQCTIVNTFGEALDAARMSTEIFVIGGARLYEEALKVASRMYITVVLESFSGDTLFPKWNADEWKIISAQDVQDGPVSTRFEIWDKKRTR